MRRVRFDLFWMDIKYSITIFSRNQKCHFLCYLGTFYKNVDYVWICFWDSPFCSIDLYVYTFANTVLYWLLYKFTSKDGTRKVSKVTRSKSREVSWQMGTLWRVVFKMLETPLGNARGFGFAYDSGTCVAQDRNLHTWEGPKRIPLLKLVRKELDFITFFCDRY